MSTKSFDLQAWLAGTGREVARDGERARAVVVRRRFDAPVERVWDAWVTGWTSKIASGEARPGETVVLALGQPKPTLCRILACEPPERLVVTWIYGEQPADIAPDEVEVRLARDGEGTMLTLEHRSEYGAPWAAGVGAGWEAGLMMFDFELRGEDPASIPTDVVWPRLDAFWVEFVGDPA